MSQYNGWTNYETWRVNLELFDGFDASDYLQDFDPAEEKGDAVSYLASVLEDFADEILRTEIPSEVGFAYNLAQGFLNRVDFEEIAEHMVEDYAAELV